MSKGTFNGWPKADRNHKASTGPQRQTAGDSCQRRSEDSDATCAATKKIAPGRTMLATAEMSLRLWSASELGTHGLACNFPALIETPHGVK